MAQHSRKEEGVSIRAPAAGFRVRQPPAAFLLHFDAVASVSRAAADLLRLCAFLHPDAIPEEIFSAGAAELGPNLSATAADPFKLDEAFAQILKYSLLRRDAEAKMLRIHRLVQAVIQDGLTEEEKRQWAQRTVRAVNRAFPVVEFANWPQCDRLLPQASVCAALVETYLFEFKEAARLLNRAGDYFHRRARFPDAEPLYQRALAIREKVLGPDHSDLATVFENYAALLREMKRGAAAREMEARAQAIRAAHAKHNPPK
jgi:tetratricopeptide (TPR) repeat protein